MRKSYRTVFLLMCLLLVCLCFAGCSDEKKNTAPVATVESNSVANVTISGAVSDEIKNKIDFDAYKNQNAYKLDEKNSEQDIKLLYPVNIYKTDTMDVQYHVEVRKLDNGNVVLEVLGTDFTITKNVKEIKVEWKSVGIKPLQTESVYRFTGLCITVDGEVYFYEDEFHSPIIEGREMAYNAVG